jgi:hypothetical protein
MLSAPADHPRYLASRAPQSVPQLFADHRLLGAGRSPSTKGIAVAEKPLARQSSLASGRSILARRFRVRAASMVKPTVSSAWPTVDSATPRDARDAFAGRAHRAPSLSLLCASASSWSSLRSSLFRHPARRGQFEVVEQRSRLTQVRGIEPLAEPRIDVLQQGARVLATTAARPQAAQARRGAQLERPRVLPPRDLEGLTEARLGIRLRGCPGPVSVCRLSAPFSRYSSASQQGCLRSSPRSNAWLTAARPCAGCPIFSFTSAINARYPGMRSSIPASRSAVTPSRICARPSAARPSAASSQPRWISPSRRMGRKPSSIVWARAASSNVS